jgi:hypothetical protein
MHGKLKTNTNLLVSAYEKYHKDYLWRTSVNYCTSHQFYFTTEYTTISVLISLLLAQKIHSHSVSNTCLQVNMTPSTWFWFYRQLLSQTEN